METARALGDRGNESAARTNLLSLQTTRTRHVGNDPNVERYDRISGPDEFAFLINLARHIQVICSTTIGQSRRIS